MTSCQTILLQKNKWLNQKIRCKYQNKKEMGKYYRKKHNKGKIANIPKRTLTLDGIKRSYEISLDSWSLQDFVPNAPFTTVNHWIHPMSDTNLGNFYEDIQIQQDIESNQNQDKHDIHLEQNEKVVFSLRAYLHDLYICYGIQTSSDIQEIIRRYLWQIPSFSMHCIAATHLIASVINRFINSAKHKCEFSHNNDLNILKYIFVRGGALRDCHLLRKMRDVDLIVNIYELSRAHLQHLNKYHRFHSNANDSKCIFWRRYLNKFKSSNSIKKEKFKFESSNLPYAVTDADVSRIQQFEYNIATSNYSLNSQFIVDILRKQNKYSFDIKSSYHKLHWELALYDIGYDGFNLDQVQFDLGDQLGNLQAKYKSYTENGVLRGLDDTISNTVAKISAFTKTQDIMQRGAFIDVSLPLYPFESSESFEYIDFTVNGFHIDLYSVLMNNYSNAIDYNWECKVQKKYDNEVVNRFNMMAMRDINNKIIRCPSFTIINEENGSFYFWRLVKLAQKLITQIEKDVWKVDKKYLYITKKQYKTWFDNDEFIETDAKNRFIHKLLRWNIEDRSDFIKRFKVFQLIGFDKHFIAKLRNYPSEFGGLLKNAINYSPHLNGQDICALKYCFSRFGYPNIGILREKRINYGNVKSSLGIFSFVDYP